MRVVASVCQTPRVNPKVVVSSKVGLKVWVSLIAKAWALSQPGPPWQGSVKFLKAIKAPACGVVLIREFPLSKLFCVKRWSILTSNCLLELWLRTGPEPVLIRLPPERWALESSSSFSAPQGQSDCREPRIDWARVCVSRHVVVGNELAAQDAASIELKTPE
jgi:hypothetical protein